MAQHNTSAESRPASREALAQHKALARALALMAIERLQLREQDVTPRALEDAFFSWLGESIFPEAVLRGFIEQALHACRSRADRYTFFRRLVEDRRRTLARISRKKPKGMSKAARRAQMAEAMHRLQEQEDALRKQETMGSRGGKRNG